MPYTEKEKWDLVYRGIRESYHKDTAEMLVNWLRSSFIDPVKEAIEIDDSAEKKDEIPGA